MPIRFFRRPATPKPRRVDPDRRALRARGGVGAAVNASAARPSTAPSRARAAPALRWLALVAVFALPGLARAGDTAVCSPLQAQAGQEADNSLDAATQRMLAAVPACQKDANFLAALGRLLNRQGRYLEAADHLERALMLAPDLKDAQLSYAIALTGSGDLLSAAALIDNLLADPALPPHLRPLIQQQKDALAAAEAGGEGWQSRLTLAARLGYDSNLLGSPNLGSLALTLSGQTLVLPLDESYLARGGGYARADAQLDLHRSAPDGVRWDAVLSLRSRHSPAVQAAGSRQADLLLERSHTASSAGGSYINMSAATLQSQAGTRYLAWGAAGGWGGAVAATCQARVGAEWQARQYLDNQVLSGRYRGLSAFWSCEQLSGVQWLLGLKAGRDAAQQAERPGGDQTQASLRVAGFWPLAALLPDAGAALAGLRRGGLLLDFEQTELMDARGYSPIMDSGRTRSVSRSAARLEYQQPIARSVQWVLGAEWVAQRSSLALFRQDNWGSYTGLRLNW